VLEDSAEAAVLRAAGPAHAVRFDWNEVARRHLALWRALGRG
jgi:hypothetical protein